MRYRHVVAPLPMLMQLAQDQKAPVGTDIIEFFLNEINRGRRLVGFSATLAPTKDGAIPHYHFVFEDLMVTQ